MKKIIALLLTFAMIVSGLVFSVQAENVDSVDADIEFQILEQLGIMDSNTDLDAIVTRGEFAEYVGRMLNISSSYSDKSYFTDVKGNSVINVLTEMGIFTGTDEHLFEPENEIDMNHACVALVKALGYRLGTENVTVYDYISFAKRLDIVKNVNLSAKATNKSILKMIYNTLTAVAGKPEYYTESDGSFAYQVSSKGTETLMEVVFEAYVIEGQVTENCYTGLYDSGSVENDEIKIGTTKYRCEIDGAERLIGQNVVALVSFKDKKSSDHTIMYIAVDAKESETLVLDADDIVSYDNYVLRYYDNADKIKEIRFESSMSLIYNGVAIGNNYKQYFEFDMGTLRCIKGESNLYNVAIIEHIENVKVKAVDLTENIVYTDGVAPYNALDMSDKDADTYRKINVVESGKTLGVQSLTNGDLLSVIRSADGKYIEAYLCTETVEGVLSSVKDGNKKLYNIDGIEYEAAVGYDPLQKYNIGDNVKYVLDYTGKIATEGTTDTLDGKVLGYLYMMSEVDGPFDKTVKFKIYNQNKEHIVVECADKVKIDGVRVEEKEVPKKLKNFDGSFKRTIILYKLNKNGELSYIDTPAETKDAKEEINSIWKVADEGTYKFDDSANIFRPHYAADNQTYVFAVPFDDNDNPTERAFGVYTFSGNTPFTRYTDYSGVAMYKFSDDTPYIDVITLRRSEGVGGSLGIYDDVLLVDEIATELGEDGEIVNKIYGLMRNAVVEYRVESELDISAVDSGDIIKFARNNRGYVSTYELIYDYSTDEKKWGAEYESATFGTSERYTLGYLDSIFINNAGNNYTTKSLFNVSETLGGEVAEAHAWHTNNNTFMIYDGSRRTNKAYLGSINDLATYENVQSDASRLFVQWRYQNRISWIFYK